MLTRFISGAIALVGIAAVGLACSVEPVETTEPAETVETDDRDSLVRTVKARVQVKPGGEIEKVEMEVHPAATELRIVSASEASLEDKDLVLGVVADGQAVAYPIRYLAMHEVANDHVGAASLAPTW